ncbi:unnamed protein product [Paramecium octaurelia]|uniref:Uncharacterized protein n=1 Tax=Paramecium octaurelia TaxID=43137 RepID=A0A8S1WU40_PAROT|nr:unnamed protein product [Paramecium octaurelia]
MQKVNYCFDNCLQYQLIIEYLPYRLDFNIINQGDLLISVQYNDSKGLDNSVFKFSRCINVS